MKKLSELAALSGIIASIWSSSASQFATDVIAYTTGSGFAPGFTNSAAILGGPSIETLDPQFGNSPVDPFDPPYLSNQIVSVGAGGSLTVRFDQPIDRSALHPYNLDFIVFGHAGFDTGPDYNGIANGTLFDNNAIQTAVYVSADGTNFFQLDPSKAPVLDGMFPTDGQGDPSVPADPTLVPASFTGKDIAGVRALYAGSAGGAGFSLAWAIDDASNAVTLQSVHYLRLSVLQGHADLDAVAAVSNPKPAPGGGWIESFRQDPATTGWKIFGDSSLFRWDSTNENLAVTWDSSHPNSYFYRPLGALLDRTVSFSLAFDLQLNDIAIGTETNKPGTFELALGFMNFNQATNAGFLRGTGTSTPDLFEFDYFPDSGFGPTIWPTIVSSNNDFLSLNYVILPLEPGPIYHVFMNYSGASNLLSTLMTADGAPFTNVISTLPAATAAGFGEDTFAIESYSSAGQDPEYPGSILAHGIVDNIEASFAAVPTPRLSIQWGLHSTSIGFTSQSNLIYSLQRTSDFVAWSIVAPDLNGRGSAETILDTNPPSGRAFYRLSTRAP